MYYVHTWWLQVVDASGRQSIGQTEMEFAIYPQGVISDAARLVENGHGKQYININHDVKTSAACILQTTRTRNTMARFTTQVPWNHQPHIHSTKNNSQQHV